MAEHELWLYLVWQEAWSSIMAATKFIKVTYTSASLTAMLGRDIFEHFDRETLCTSGTLQSSCFTSGRTAFQVQQGSYSRLLDCVCCKAIRSQLVTWLMDRSPRVLCHQMLCNKR